MHLLFVPIVRHRISNDVEYIAFRHQTTGTKNKCIDRVDIKVIDRRIRDRMDKMTMNRPLWLKPGLYNSLLRKPNYFVSKLTKRSRCFNWLLKHDRVVKTIF